MIANQKDMQQKNVIVVLGMARSGTSAIARGLKALGVELGNNLVQASERWNAKGFFEDEDIVYKINRGIFYALDHQWMSINLNDELQKKSGMLYDLRNSAVALLKQRMSATQYWGFKDPRTAKLLPFWQDVFTALNLQDSYLIALRNPLESAYSYQNLSGCDLEEALLLWLVHLVCAIDGTNGKKRVIVSYNLMMQDPRCQLKRIKAALGIPDLADSAEIETYANEFLDKKLHHYECNTEDLKSHLATKTVPLCVSIYELLLRLAKDEINFNDQEFITRWHDIKTELDKVYPIYNYIDSLLKRKKVLERKIRTTQKSILWKLIYPLRIIDDTLRSRRRKARERKRLLKVYE